MKLSISLIISAVLSVPLATNVTAIKFALEHPASNNTSSLDSSLFYYNKHKIKEMSFLKPYHKDVAMSLYNRFQAKQFSTSSLPRSPKKDCLKTTADNTNIGSSYLKKLSVSNKVHLSLENHQSKEQETTELHDNHTGTYAETAQKENVYSNRASNLLRTVHTSKLYQNREDCCLENNDQICIIEIPNLTNVTRQLESLEDIPSQPKLPLVDHPVSEVVDYMCDKLGNAVCLASLECDVVHQNRNCSILEPCILDVSYRLHACIDGFLYESQWAQKDFVIICAEFPYEVWNEKGLAQKIVKFIIMLPVSLIGVVSNGIVLYVIIRHRHLHRPINIFVGNLALAQLLFSGICPHLFLVSDFSQNYNLGFAGCKTQGFLELLFMLVSEFSMIGVCIERLVMVTSLQLFRQRPPQRKRQSLKLPITICFSIWLFSGLVASPVVVNRFFANRKWLNYEETFCSEWKWMTRLYWPSVAIVLIYFPMIFLIAAYMHVFFKLDSYELSTTDRQEPLVKWALRRHLRLLFVVLLIFFACFTPYTLFIIVRVLVVNYYNEAEQATLFHIQWWLSNWLLYVNCAINPIIYGLYHDNFKKVWPTAIFIKHWDVPPIPAGQNSPKGKAGHECSKKYQYLRRPSTPLAVEALRSLGKTSQYSRRGHSKMSAKRTSSLCSCGQNCGTQCLEVSSYSREYSRNSRTRRSRSLSSRKSTPDVLEIFVTKTSQLAFITTENDTERPFIENESSL